MHLPIFEPRFRGCSARSIVTKASTFAYVIHTHSCLHLPACRTYSSGLSPAALLPVHVLSVWDGTAESQTVRTCTSMSSVRSYLLQQTPCVAYTSLRHFSNIQELITGSKKSVTKTTPVFLLKYVHLTCFMQVINIFHRLPLFPKRSFGISHRAAW